MPLPKGFYFIGEHIKLSINTLSFLLIGTIGALIVFLGVLHEPSQNYFVFGSLMLLITAIRFRLIYFIALEIIILCGHGAILLEIGPIIQMFLPILLSVQLFVYYWLSGALKNVFRIIGIIGIALLSIGFSFKNQWVFFVGSLCVAIYAIYSFYRGHKVAIIWAILNLAIATFNGYLILS